MWLRHIPKIHYLTERQVIRLIADILGIIIVIIPCTVCIILCALYIHSFKVFLYSLISCMCLLDLPFFYYSKALCRRVSLSAFPLQNPKDINDKVEEIFAYRPEIKVRKGEKGDVYEMSGIYQIVLLLNIGYLTGLFIVFDVPVYICSATAFCLAGLGIWSLGKYYASFYWWLLFLQALFGSLGLYSVKYLYLVWPQYTEQLLWVMPGLGLLIALVLSIYGNSKIGGSGVGSH